MAWITAFMSTQTNLIISLYFAVYFSFMTINAITQLWVSRQIFILVVSASSLSHSTSISIFLALSLPSVVLLNDMCAPYALHVLRGMFITNVLDVCYLFLTHRILHNSIAGAEKSCWTKSITCMYVCARLFADQEWTWWQKPTHNGQTIEST